MSSIDRLCASDCNKEKDNDRVDDDEELVAVGLFTTKMGRNAEKYTEDDTEKQVEGGPRRCDRFKDKKEMRVEDMVITMTLMFLILQIFLWLKWLVRLVLMKDVLLS